jgi:hypothetical protein
MTADVIQATDMTTSVRREPLTVYQYVLAGQPLREGNGQLPQVVEVKGTPMTAIGIDPGNGEMKAAMMALDGRLVTVQIISAYKIAVTLGGGKSPTTYTVNGGPAFWIGADAVQMKGDALPIGPTAVRLEDPRQVDFYAAGVVELLIKARCAPGQYTVAAGLALPNMEMQPQVKKNDSGEEAEVMAVILEAKQAIKQHIYGKTYQISRTDEDGEVTNWSITFGNVYTQAQSYGTFMALTHTIFGSRRTDGIQEYAIIDMGRGDTHETLIQLAPTFRMTTRRTGEGTIKQARAVARALPEFDMNDAQAQHALITRSILDGGRPTSISAVVDKVVERETQETLSRLLPALRNRNAYIAFTGGGTKDATTLQIIHERMESVSRSPDSYVIVHPEVASVLNAVGTLLKVLFTELAKKGRA